MLIQIRKNIVSDKLHGCLLYKPLDPKISGPFVLRNQAGWQVGIRIRTAKDGPETNRAQSRIILPGIISASGARLHFSEGLFLGTANKIRF